MNIIQNFELFPTQEACITHLEKARWGDTPACPYCGSINTAKLQHRRRCYDCKTSFSVTVGTIFHHTHLPLQKWFLAVMLILNARKSLSTLQLSRYLKINKNTAWRIAMQIRKAMSQAEQRKLLTGIIALVDEATGYEKIKTQRALATILEKFIATELQPWTKTFPYDFYELLYKLRGCSGPEGHKRTHQVAHDTNDLVYERLAPGVLKELRRKNSIVAPGRRKNRHHQWFTPDLGHPKLKLHLAGVMALMRAAPNWDSFKRSLQRAFPKKNITIPMALDDDI